MGLSSEEHQRRLIMQPITPLRLISDSAVKNGEETKSEPCGQSLVPGLYLITNGNSADEMDT